MNSKTIKKPGNDKKYLRKDKNYCLVCKSDTKYVLAYNPIVKIGKREIATQGTKCNKFQKNKSTFLKEIDSRKKVSLNKKTWIFIAKTAKNTLNAHIQKNWF